MARGSQFRHAVIPIDIEPFMVGRHLIIQDDRMNGNCYTKIVTSMSFSHTSQVHHTLSGGAFCLQNVINLTLELGRSTPCNLCPRIVIKPESFESIRDTSYGLHKIEWSSDAFTTRFGGSPYEYSDLIVELLRVMTDEEIKRYT